MIGRLHNNWDDCVFHVDYRTGLTNEWVLGRTATVAAGSPELQRGSGGVGVSFMDNTDYFTYGTDFTGLPLGNSARTVSGLVEYTTIDTSYMGVFAYGKNVAWQSWSFGTTSSGYNYKLAGIHRIGGLVSVGTNDGMLDYPNRLVFMTITHDENELVLYVDGIRDPVTTFAGSFDTTTDIAQPIQVGRAIASGRWCGMIYTATLFDKALSDEEVRVHTEEIMNNPRTLMSGR